MARTLDRRIWLLVLLAIGCAACAKSRGGQTGDEDELPTPAQFYGNLAAIQDLSDYEPASSAGQLASRSDRVVVGTPVSLRAGQAAGSDHTVGPVVLEVAEERVLVGDEGPKTLYLELFVGAEDNPTHEDLPATVSGARVIVFASVVPEPEAEAPDGATLYGLGTPQGFAVESDEGFFQPFVEDELRFGDASFEELAAEVEMASASGNADDCPVEATSCPAECFEMTAYPYDESGACFAPMREVVGCTPDEAGTADEACVERLSDGARFIATQGSPFRNSAGWQECTDPPVPLDTCEQ